jgi:16S rRNA (adenine1518-N6/adenine1519-N6)-dimethyltransferase
MSSIESDFMVATLTPLDIPSILRQAGLKPSRGLGQNFLSDMNVLQRIIECAEVGNQDSVLEIGPGLGSLTRQLAICAQSVIAIEIDRKIFPLLQEIVLPFPNVSLICGDILEQRLNEMDLKPGYLVVANIPYYITSAVIRYLLESHNQPARIVLTVQEEVARRICSSDGDLNLLALSVQVYGKPNIAMNISAGAFYPSPKVDSAVIRIDLYSKPLIPVHQLASFFRLCKAGFGQKRKTLRNSLSGGLHMQNTEIEEILGLAGIDPMRRAETLGMDEWKVLTDIWVNRK